MDKEKFSMVLSYFNDIGVEVPTSVKNAIEDVFMENDNVDSVECYHLEDIEQLQSDLKLKNDVEMTLGGGNRGDTVNVWTYYGEVEYSYSENVKLISKDGAIEEDITKLESDGNTIILNKRDWIVSLVERLKWTADDENLSRETMLYIFCPHPAEEFEYQDIYDIIAEEDR